MGELNRRRSYDAPESYFHIIILFPRGPYLASFLTKDFISPYGFFFLVLEQLWQKENLHISLPKLKLHTEYAFSYFIFVTQDISFRRG